LERQTHSEVVTPAAVIIDAVRSPRLMTTLLGVLEQRGGRFGLQVMCEAGGLANATIIERLA
jgi:acetyl-CoA acetyltransferase